MDTSNKKTEQKHVQLVVFTIDHEEYALRIENTQEVIKMSAITTVPNSPRFIAGIINLRGQIISILDLEKRFNLTRSDTTVAPQNIIVLTVADVTVGIIVDEVVEILKIGEHMLQEAPKTVVSKIGAEHINGVVVVTSEDEQVEKKDRVLLVLNVDALMSTTESQAVSELVEHAPPVPDAPVTAS